MTPSPSIQRPNGHFRQPENLFPTVPQQRLDAVWRSLARTAEDAAARIAPEPGEWEMHVGIARTAIRRMAEVDG